MTLNTISPAARLVGALVLATLLTAVWSVAARGQPPSPHAEAQGRILKSSNLQREALQVLDNPSHAEELVRAAREELHVALQWLASRRDAKTFTDPLFRLNTGRIQRALALLQRAGEALSATARQQAEGESAASARRLDPPPPARPDYGEVVRTNLVEALRVTNSIVVF
jgi:hypothetical protein